MSIIRGGGMRRKSRGSIQERVTIELKRLDAERAKSACHHRWTYTTSRALGSMICMDCGARPQ